MRLNRITITGFKNLRDFEIDFDETSQTSVLVGRNGTGKSNLLEALVIIFRDLDLGERTTFAYRIEYLVEDKRVVVDWDPSRKKPLQASMDGISVAKGAITAKGSRLLPRFIFGYYSGPTNRMEEHFNRHQERFYSELLKERPASTARHQLRRLFYSRQVHSKFVLLAFFLRDDPVMQRFLKSHLKVESLDSVLFEMRAPSWNSKQGDERFWYAKGEVSRFLGLLYRHSLAPMRLSYKVPVGFRKTTKREHLYLYLNNVEQLQRLSEQYFSEQDFFTALESTYISEVIGDVRIRVKVRNVDGVLTQRELSEGEQQLLMVLGLLRFTREDESLFLLDEPDTHLNPAWSLEYLRLIEEIVGAQPNSHIIMATHDPLVICGLTRSQVHIMTRDDDSGRIKATMPNDDPRGLGIAGLLKSDLFGLRSTLDIQTLDMLDRQHTLLGKGENSTAEERYELESLQNQLGRLGFTTEFRDPYYEQFAKAIARRKEFQKPTLSPAERVRQEVLADEILDKLMESEQSK